MSGEGKWASRAVAPDGREMLELGIAPGLAVTFQTQRHLVSRGRQVDEPKGLESTSNNNGSPLVQPDIIVSRGPGEA